MTDLAAIPLVEDADIIREAGIDSKRAEIALTEAQHNLSNKTQLKHQKEVTLTALIEKVQADNLERVLKGEAAVPRKPEDEKQVRELTADVAALATAVQILGDEVTQAQATFETALLKRPSAITPVIFNSKIQAAQTLRQKLAETLEAAAALAAHQAIQDQLLGDKFRLKSGDDTEGNFNSAMLVDALYARMPPRLRPSGEQLQELTERSAMLADLTLTLLREKS